MSVSRHYRVGARTLRFGSHLARLKEQSNTIKNLTQQELIESCNVNSICAMQELTRDIAYALRDQARSCELWFGGSLSMNSLGARGVLSWTINESTCCSSL
jgi:hypothetical protein